MKLLLLTVLFWTASFAVQAQGLTCGADQPEAYLNLLEGKTVGLVVNQSSTVGDEHLLDFLLSKNVAVEKIFCPEHGFREMPMRAKRLVIRKTRKQAFPSFRCMGKIKSHRQLSCKVWML